jgi:hypothetical protein
MMEWSNIKIIGLAIDKRGEEAVDFKSESSEPECSGCELPLRYGLSCKHWMYPAFLKDCQLPLSLFYPRWLFDGLPVLHERWKMLWSDSTKVPLPTRIPETSRSRFHGRGEEMVNSVGSSVVV